MKFTSLKNTIRFGRVFFSTISIFFILGAAWQFVGAFSGHFSNDSQKQTINSGSSINIYLPLIGTNVGNPENPPFITFFETNAVEIENGGSATLSWNYQNDVTAVTLEPSGTPLADGNGAVVNPTETTTYKLTIENDFGTDTAELTVAVVEAVDPPTINSFTVSEDRVPEGTPTTLSWDVDGTATTLSISPDVGDVTGLTSIEVYPTADTTYTLTAVNSKGSVDSDLSIVYILAPQITSFSANDNTIDEGDNTTLTWTTEGSFDSITLNPGNIDVTTRSNLPVSPVDTTEYSLTIAGEGGQNTETYTVNVINPPVINSFSITNSGDIYIGDTLTFNWDVDNPITSLTIDQSVGDVTGLESTTATAASDLTYTITAVNSAGSDTAQVVVDVIEAPVIDSFTTDDEWIITGNDTTLSWTVTGENVLLSLSDGIGDVSGLDEQTVSPTETNVYTLTATNNSGSDTATVTVNVSSGASEITVFNWNREVTKNQHGFPNNTPPTENYDYTGFPNYAQGTLYFRVEIFSQPVAQSGMKMQLCYWQELNGYNFELETCGSLVTVAGTTGNIVCWDQPIGTMWKKDGNPIDWTRPRYRIGVAIKNAQKLPVSDWTEPEWGNEDPDDWYPLDMHFQAILVAEGETFSGFSDCTID